MNRSPDLDLTDELLREWGHFFRDRRQFERCRSIEHRFRATSEDFGPDGWGDEEAAPKTQPRGSYSLRRALQTHDALQLLKPIQKWAVTYAFAYPGLPKFVVLRCMRKWTGRRLNWQGYLEQLDLGRFRVHGAIASARLLTAPALYAIR